MTNEPRRRPKALALAIGASLAVHALLLSIRFGVHEQGWPGLRLPWHERRGQAPDLRVVLAPPAAAEATVSGLDLEPNAPAAPAALGTATAATASATAAAVGPGAEGQPFTLFDPPVVPAVLAEPVKVPTGPSGVRSTAAPADRPARSAATSPTETPADRPAAPLLPQAAVAPSALEPPEPDAVERLDGVAPAAAPAMAVIALDKVDAARLSVPPMPALTTPAIAAAPAISVADPAQAASAETARAEAARPQTARPPAEPRADPQAAARQAAAQREAARIEAARLEAARIEAARLESARAEPARIESARAEAARIEVARVEAARLEAARADAARAEAAKQEAAKQEAVKQEAARAEAARAEAARAEAARAEAARAETARQQATRQAAADADTERREAARRAMGRQLDEEAAQRDAAAAAAATQPPRTGAPTTPPPNPLPYSWSSPRRARLFGRTDPNAELVLYAEAWARKIQLNTAPEHLHEAANRAHASPLVTVALRSDGSVESVTFVRSSGLVEVDELVRRLVQRHAPYPTFPPPLARQFDVVEIRRTWHFDMAVRLY